MPRAPGSGPRLFGLPRSDRDERRLREQAMAALGRVGVADLADSMPDTLAYGLRKRVALARALAGIRGCCCWTSRPAACPRRNCPSSAT